MFKIAILVALAGCAFGSSFFFTGKFSLLSLSLPMTTQETFLETKDHDQTAQNMQSDL